MTVADRSSESQRDPVEGRATRAPTEAPPPSAPLTSRRAWITAAILTAGVVLWGGYSRHWAWTGINGSTATLWDWLHLLALPFAVGVLPIWLSHRTRVHRPHRAAALALLGAFVALVIIGYLVPWTWTGFAGNTLWDWLNLVALPLAVALMPVYRDLRRHWNPRHSRITVARARAVRPRRARGLPRATGRGRALPATRCGTGYTCFCSRCFCRRSWSQACGRCSPPGSSLSTPTRPKSTDVGAEDERQQRGVDQQDVEREAEVGKGPVLERIVSSGEPRAGGTPDERLRALRVRRCAAPSRAWGSPPAGRSGC